MPPKFKKASPATNKQGPRVLYWFRTDLRLHDSPGLMHALSLNPSALIPLWTWDPHYVYRQRGAANRWNFLLECMCDVSRSLGDLNAKQKLFVVRAAPQVVLPRLCEKWGVDVLVFEADSDAYGRSRDDGVRKALEGITGGGGKKVEVVAVKGGRTLFDPEEVGKQNGGKPTMSMAQLLKASAKIEPGDGGAAGEPRKPVDRPATLPDPLSTEELDLSDLEKKLSTEERQEQARPGWPRVEGLDYNAVQRTGKDQETQFSVGLMGPNRDFAVPTLEELGIDAGAVTTPHRGGETAGLELLAKHIKDEEYIGTFEKPATAPTGFDPPATTLLSPHMHFGSVSCRKFWWDVQGVIERRRKAKKHVSQQPVNIPGQLLFRDMYFAAHAQVGITFGQQVGNPVARFVPWHLQSCYSTKGPDGKPLADGTYTVDSPEAEEYFLRWKHGRTGFPWIDALMRQLKQEGWIHHLGRHAVACFLTRGGCYVSWERGAEVFEEWLIDHEVACNAGNWMWLSCTAFFSQFYRCYSPVAFPKKWDPEGHFVRKYVPELAAFDKKYIYEPHKAPIVDQKSWGCVVKGNGSGQGDNKEYKVYPKPMFDFQERRQFCIDQVKRAYDVGLYGDDEKVISGKWKELFDRDDDGGTVREEANGELSRGAKRSRNEVDDQHEDDMGEGADIGDESGDESHDDRPARRKVAKNGPGKKGQQGTLDAMVTRGKGQGKVKSG